MENHVLMFPDMFINSDSNSVKIGGASLNYRKLLLNTLYWDRIIVTQNNFIHISFDASPGFSELKKAGILHEENLKVGTGDIARSLYDAHMKFLLDCLARKDINFIASDADKVLIKNSNQVSIDNGELFTLINAIPEPDESVNINDALEFRLKRKDDLKNLMNKINELNIRVLKAENRDMELKAAINEIDIACSDVIRLYAESGIKFNLSEVKFNFNVPEIAVNASAAYIGAKTFGLPETGAVLASIAYGFNTFVNFSSSMSLRKIDKSNPFNYVGEMSKKLN
ncbi:TPA: hypothetical protein PCF38_003246 [Klebsiella pneumoniae]|nr:hypothetical protein [Klebsiella pneumoniae]